MDQRDDYSFARGQMAPDEYVLWTGRPEQGTILSAVPFSSYLTSLGVIAISLLMFRLCRTAADTSEKPLLLFWFIFTAVGIYGLVIWPFQAQHLRKRTFYVITNKKIYRQRGRKFDTLAATDMPGYETKYHNNGKGTIQFTIISSPSWTGNRAITTYFTLDNVPDVDRALQAIARMDTNK